MTALAWRNDNGRRAGPSNAQNRRVLCVDDEPYILSALSRVLSEQFDLETATSGGEALAKLSVADAEYAAIVTDMRMPAMTGATLLGRVRMIWPHTVRILLTGDTDADAAKAAVNTGEIFRFLTKPCPNATLRMTLELAIERHDHDRRGESPPSSSRVR
jgi:DNA-binding NtrC family response regulator